VTQENDDSYSSVLRRQMEVPAEPPVATPSRKPRRNYWKIVVLVWVGLALVGGMGAFLMIHSSDATKLAIATAESNPAVAERLGRPLKPGWLITGNIHMTNASEGAELDIPISGPKGSGTLHAEARKRAGNWKLQVLQFCVEGSSERLDLLSTDSKPQQASPTP